MKSRLATPQFTSFHHDEHLHDVRSSSHSTRRTRIQPQTRAQRWCHPREVLSSSELDLTRHDNEVDELEDHTIMAVDKTPSGKVGCAYYIARHQLLCCMQDVDTGGSELVERLKVEIDPTVVLVSSRAKENVTSQRLQTQSSLVNADPEHTTFPWEIIVRPLSDFKYENAISKLGTLDTATPTDSMRFLVPGENMDYSEAQQINELGLIGKQGRLLSIASSLEIDNLISVGCVGAVISYLQRKRASEYLQNDPAGATAYRVVRFEMFTLRDTMLINLDALSSLQIIQTETHPNLANQGPRTTGSKESLSVYGLFQHFSRTPQGKARLRRMFLRPALDLNEIVARQNFVSVFTRAENQSLGDTLSKSLRRIKDMRITITSLHKGVQRGSQSSGTIRSGVWAAILDFCYHCIDIGDTLREVVGQQGLNILAEAEDVLDKAHTMSMGKMVHDVVDLDESLEQHRTVVKRGIDKNLDTIKDAYDAMEEVLKNVALEITNSMPEHIEYSLNVVYLPQLGFHVTVPLDEATGDPVWEGDDKWERRFSTDHYQYFKNDKMREMDIYWGDLHALICDTEIEISHNLAQRVLEDEDWFLKASSFCGELDSLLALAHGALRYKLTRPNYVEDNIIDIKGGRHILQEMTVGSYVANDVFLTGGDEQIGELQGPSMLLLTGPNFSGKSVLMKQVALIVYMGQVGSFVPADAARLGLTDKILTRINTAETVSKMQSAFVIDLQQISRSLRSCTNRSLVIIDEFGKGTDSCDGAGLASGVFKFLLELKLESPKVLASTHFHEIFEQGDFDQFLNLAFGHLRVHVDSGGITEASRCGEVTYLYKLCEGRSTLSYGIQCATANGIPREVVDKAKLLADLITRGDDLILTCATMPDNEVRELEEAEAICRMFLSKDLADRTADIRAFLMHLR